MFLFDNQDPLKYFFEKYKNNLSKKNIDKECVLDFQKTILNFYQFHKREFLWRTAITPYRVVVSEIMLQQTQTGRVSQKFELFIKKFPDFFTLAQAAKIEVLAEWIGLGYNRRAIALHECAKKVIHEWNGLLPDDPQLLQTCKGIGPATAASIVAFAFNKPTIFIETNIRSVYLHIFFQDSKQKISDADLITLIQETLDQSNPREWYYALMDYGVLIKKLYKNPNHKSKHYAIQSTFKGSDRELRGAILRLLLEQKKAAKDLLFNLNADKARMQKILDDLIKENFIVFFDNGVKSFFTLLK